MPAERELTLFVCGDVMTGRGVDQILPCPSAPRIHEGAMTDARGYVELAEAKNGPISRPVDFSYIWGDALSELERAAPHARIVNLETSVTRSEAAAPKGINYRMHPANVPCLQAANIDLCVLANNHVLDYGGAGLLETLSTLRRAGVLTAGAGRDLDEAQRPAVIDTALRSRVLVIGLASRSSGVPSDWAAGIDRPGVDYLWDLSEESAGAVAARARSMKRLGDRVVVSIHWGSNWGYDVPAEHVRFAHRLIDLGVDLVHGHSSHHPRPIEVYRDKLVLYGCGDLINDYEGISGYEELRSELVLLYLATLSGATGALVRLRLVPMRIERMRLVRATPGERRWLRERLSDISRAHGRQLALCEDGSLELRRSA